MGGSPAGVDNFESDNLQNGVTVQSMSYVDSTGAKQNTGNVAFISSFGAYDTSTLTDPTRSLISQSQQVGLFVVPLSGLGQTAAQAPLSLDANLRFASQPQEVDICLLSGGSQKSALISIGSTTGQQLSVTATIKNSTDCS